MALSAIPAFATIYRGYEVSLYGYDAIEEKYLLSVHADAMIKSVRETTRGYAVEFQPVTISGSTAYISEIHTLDGRYEAYADPEKDNGLVFLFESDEEMIMTDQYPEEKEATLIQYTITLSNGISSSISGAIAIQALGE